MGKRSWPPAAGWYPDTHQLHRQRWWTGDSWSHDVRLPEPGVVQSRPAPREAAASHRSQRAGMLPPALQERLVRFIRLAAGAIMVGVLIGWTFIDPESFRSWMSGSTIPWALRF